MNSLLEQFLPEARDALEGIGDKLMQLEHAPDDAELMTQLFRLVHTLKGNSGLFDFPEMTRVLHAGEDLMDAVRHGQVAYSPDLADRLLDAMDFVGRLCDEIEKEHPSDPATATQAAQLAAALRALIVLPPPDSDNSHTVSSPATKPAAPTLPSPAELLRVPEEVRQQAWQRAQAGEPLLWVRYGPDAGCFFQGEDPLHQARLTPGLLWGGISARQSWPPLITLDAYNCQLDFAVLTVALRSEIETHFRYVPEQIEILPLPALALVLPSGELNGGPVYEDFVTDALDFVRRHDLAGLERTVRLMLELSNSNLWLASALRWMQILLQSPNPDPHTIETLVVSLREQQAPDWNPILCGVPTVAPPPVAPVAATPAPLDINQHTLHELLAVQREVLALPDNDPWLAGRLKGVFASLAPCLRAAGRSAELPQLQAALQDALQQTTSAPLAIWLEDAFPAPLEPVASVAMPATEATLVATPAPPGPPVELASTRPPAAPDTAPGNTAPPPESGDGDMKMGRRSDDHLSAKSLKVDQVKIDRLMNLIGEMVVAKNAIPYLANRAETQYGMRELSREIKAQYAVINRISEEMQDAIMQVRMLPVSFVFQRFPRLVRDTARRLGKEIELVMEGQDTAADKNIIEAMGDPLVHMVRNSMDHGIEQPEVRLAAGKPAQGTLRISARQEADRVVIEVSDDGKGIDPQLIKRKAYEKGLIDETTLERISDQEAINLTFLPGFSTAESVSELSGRGVGMDVVRTAIDRVNGSIALESWLGQGTRVRLSLPLSMAVTNVMTIEADGQVFGIPMDVVVETVRVPRSNTRQIKQGMVTVLRGRVVPLKSLNRLLSLAPPPLTNDSDEYAVLVDDFCETADIILKPLEGVLSNIGLYAGSALMGDGSVLMVLNVKEML
ncbi:MULTISPECIES: chemotaxis protein CheA [Giesbergeria]|uniref:histidine kinase n=1 Tax=Giesbergeria sinuosa TaxID=80883 RepID=A0ABV9QEM5_9BURK